MENLQIFKNGEFGELGILTVDGAEYFPATACARILGYTNPQKAIRDHCKGVNKTLTPSNGGNQEINYIPEGDLYRLIVSSKLPAAEQFERWVMEEILPSIRRQGSYIPDTSKLVGEIVQSTVVEVFRQLVPVVTQLISLGGKQTATPKFEIVPDQIQPSQPKMETFPPDLLEAVNTMIEDMQQDQTLNFSRIARYCTLRGYTITSPSVKRYFDRHFSAV